MSLALPPGATHGAWWPCMEGSGTTVTDRIGGNNVSVGGTTTNIWTDGDGLTLTNGDSVTLLLEGDYFDQMLRLDNLNGSILVGCQLYHEALPALGRQFWFSYARLKNVSVGGYGAAVLTSGNESFSYGANGSGQVNHPLDLTSTALNASEQNQYVGVSLVINRLPNKGTGGLEISVWGYFRGVQDRGSNVPGLAVGTPGVDAGTAGRFFALGAPSSASSDNFGSELGMNARGRHAYAFRFSGDCRAQLPKYAYQMAHVAGYGAGSDPKFLRAG